MNILFDLVIVLLHFAYFVVNIISESPVCVLCETTHKCSEIA